MKTKQYLGLVIVLLGLLSVTAIKASDLLPPQMAIQEASDKLQQKLQDKAFSQNFAQVAQFVDQTIYPHTDFDKISELVLGKLWGTASSDEQARFKREFQTLLVRTYSRAFVEFKDWTVRFLPLDMPNGGNKVVVKTEVLQPGLQPISVNYRMLLANGEWKAYDIMIEGVSLVTNYRSTFSNEVKTKGSLDAVIDGLAKRNAEALAANNS
ncbi:toluene tolerance family protein [Methyloglobulus morosus KoM1]|uniref:Toluene tolerance family protein n=1 Tax=Methyloglobulus morosus KoM1 TaxID=1116472 RepID=V5DZV8_9GAMM|nr:ABC transporter substrate-binding protein [Methyloglobulus morosus]ESS72836.1 toluene tolerance family protein [Methyloglobulus morosus KoM1]